jgi:hypothetical protein
VLYLETTSFLAFTRSQTKLAEIHGSVISSVSSLRHYILVIGNKHTEQYSQLFDVG